jgi:hypothetical protein
MPVMQPGPRGGHRLAIEQLLAVLAVRVHDVEPSWLYSRGWGAGYYPSGILGLLLRVLLVLLLFDVIRWI